MLTVGSSGGGNKIAEFSRDFQSDFVRLLRSSHGEKKINANRFYQEYISNKEHVHMNATRWASLGEFVRYLGSLGIVKVEDSETEGLCVAYVDNSAEAVERREYLKRKKGEEEAEEETAAMLLKKQIEAAGPARKPEDGEADAGRHELKRDAGVKLSIGKPASTPTTSSAKPAAKPATGNVFAKKPTTKKPNVFGAASSKVHKDKKPTSSASSKSSSVLEKLMLQDQQRQKARRVN